MDGRLSQLKEALEKPGTGRYKHEIAEKLRGNRRVPMKWIRKWISTEWYVIGHQYLWLAAMNACIGRPSVPLHIIYQGLIKADRDTFNAALEACRGLRVPFVVISWWYGSSHPILQWAALIACIDNPYIPDKFIKKIKPSKDIRIQKIIEQLKG